MRFGNLLCRALTGAKVDNSLLFLFLRVFYQSILRKTTFFSIRKCLIEPFRENLTTRISKCLNRFGRILSVFHVMLDGTLFLIL